MKIALPVDTQDLHSPMCISFGRTPYFMIYDTDTNTDTYLDNSAISTQGGAGILASQGLVDAGVTVLLSIRCGENAAEVLREGGISMFKTQHPTAIENIEAHLAGQLQPLVEIHVGFHKQG